MIPAEEQYPAIGDYAVIGDTCTAALVSRSGSIDWLCLPDYHDPSVFGALVDRVNGGRLSVAPAGRVERTERHYMDDTLVLVTRHHTETGVLQVTDLMPMIEGRDRMLEPEREVLRLAEVVSGTVEVEVLIAPRPDYGITPKLSRDGPGCWAIRDRRASYLFRSDVPLHRMDSRLMGRETLEAGERRVVSLGFASGEIAVWPDHDDCDDKIARTCHWWRDWTSGLRMGKRYRDTIARSAHVLRLLSFGQSGAVIAAPTTSLPEQPGGTKNWDYRFCWLRDAGYILQAFTGLGETAAAEPFMRWLLHATRQTRPRLATFYDAYGRTQTRERREDRLEGYNGSGPVRIGNAAGSQLQLDVYGSLIRAAHQHVCRGGDIDSVERRILNILSEQICRIWRHPDNGVWESRGPRRHTTYGKAMCWSGLEAMLDLERRGKIRVDREHLQREADMIRDHVLHDAWSERRQSFTAAFGHDDLDAAVLTLPTLGIIDAGHPRMRATFDRIDEELGRGPLVYRNLGPDGKPGEGTFGICSFWAVEYLVRRGDVELAKERFEALLGYANDLGLFAEEVDADTGGALGNFPQGLTHVGVINAALALEDALEDREIDRKEEPA